MFFKICIQESILLKPKTIFHVIFFFFKHEYFYCHASRDVDDDNEVALTSTLPLLLRASVIYTYLSQPRQCVISLVVHVCGLYRIKRRTGKEEEEEEEERDDVVEE